MYIISKRNCQNCKTLKQMLGENIMRVHIIDAEDNMDLCRQLGVKSVPVLVKDDNSIVYDLGDIVSELEK